MEAGLSLLTTEIDTASLITLYITQRISPWQQRLAATCTYECSDAIPIDIN